MALVDLVRGRKEMMDPEKIVVVSNEIIQNAQMSPHTSKGTVCKDTSSPKGSERTFMESSPFVE